MGSSTSTAPTFDHTSVPTTSLTSTAAQRPGRGRRVAAATAAVGLGATALVGVTFVMAGGGAAGGASSPEAAVTELADAISDGDALAAIGFLAPDELSGADTFVEKMIPYAAELSEEFGEESLDVGTGLEIELEAVDVEADAAGDAAAIVSFGVVGEVTLDVGDATWIDDPFVGRGTVSDGEFSVDFDSRRADELFGGDDLEVVTVRLDGRWYVSPFLSLGHAWVESERLPVGDYELVGQPRDGAAESPTEAVERYFDLSEPARAAQVAEVLGGGEGRFFHVFADAIDASGLVAGNGLGSNDQADVDFTLTDIGDGRVEMDDVTVSVDDGYGGEFTLELSDGCGTIDDGYTRVDGCFSELFPPDAEVDDRLWFQTVEEDDGHRVVILPTVFDLLSRFIGPYDAETIRWATGNAHSDDPRPGELDTTIDVDFVGRRYVVHEFPIDDDTQYTVDVVGDHGYAIYTGDDRTGSFTETWDWDGSFQAYGHDVARVVVFSEVTDGCRGFECVPSGRGVTTLTVSTSELEVGPWNDADVLDDEPIDIDMPPDFDVFDDADTDEFDQFPVSDPRESHPMAWTNLRVSGPMTWSTSLPAGEFEFSTYSYSYGDDEAPGGEVVVAGTECALPLDSYDACTFEHAGGALDVTVTPDGDATIDEVYIALRAVDVGASTVVDERVVSLEADPATATAPPLTVFDGVPAGGILVVATGVERQDIVLGVEGDENCTGIDYGIADGEICYVEHPGGPLTLRVEGWSQNDRTGEAIVTLETFG